MRGMWKGQGQAIMQRIEAGREDRTLPRTRLSPVYVLDTNAIISYTDDEPSSSIVSIQAK